MPKNPEAAGLWAKVERERRGLSAAKMALVLTDFGRRAGFPTDISQQVVSKFEQGRNKRMPSWASLYDRAFASLDDGAEFDLDPPAHDDGIQIRLLPTFVGLGSGGTGDDEPGQVTFSRDLIERELRAEPETLLAMVAEGNSMKPDFEGGDQILVDTRRKSLAQPGAFCLWDGDGHVIKYIEKVPGTNPQRVRLLSRNSLYEPQERLLDEINLIGRVVWFGRRVH